MSIRAPRAGTRTPQSGVKSVDRGLGLNHIRMLVGALVVLASIVAVAQADTAQSRRSAHKRHSGVSKPPAAMVQPTPAPPPSPPTPAQLPPSAPRVTYQNGLLTVVANNSTLGDILNAVGSKTGASIEFPSVLAQERVMAIVGPAPAPQVLASLLNGSRYDYILLGTDGRPDLLQKAIITSKEGTAPASGGPGPATAATQPPRPAPPSPAADEDMDNAAPEETVEQPEEVPQPPPPQQGQPQPVPNPNFPVPQQGQPQTNLPQQPPSQPPQGQQPKSPEQLLQELQRLQQQQQQQQPHQQ